ncbi:hypothetical protein QBC36DRAFT_343899 [Triangularia setosa]|uniref:Uncharacterized protein n=1 Tax=Triangularia setosa TaxID=2587417 RepID=A0AAN7A8H4_9PEZI|nr:hypothetical protein QBC36DRAFT_343899 [Podospora setosa]
MPCLDLSSMTRDRREAGIHWRCFPSPALYTARWNDQSVSNIAIAGAVAGWLGLILLLRKSTNEAGTFGEGWAGSLLMGRQPATEEVETREECLQQRACVFHVSCGPS